MDLRPDRGLRDPRGKLKCHRVVRNVADDTGENLRFGNWVWQLLDWEENFGTAMKTIAVDQMTRR